MATIIGFSFLAVALTVFFILGALKWIPSSPNEKNLYCEAIRANNMIKQPVNTWTNLSYVIVGIAIMLYIDLASVTEGEAVPNLISTVGVYSILYGCCVIWLGPGSMLLHASQKVWAGWLDNISMNMFVSFIFVYDLTVLLNMDIEFFLPVYIVLNVILAVVLWFWGETHLGKWMFGIIIGAFLITDIVHMILENNRQLAWFFTGLGTFVVAFVIWILSKTDGKLCKPNSIWQGHGAWHILTSITTLMLFFYLRSEGV